MTSFSAAIGVPYIMRIVWKYKIDHLAFWLLTVLFYALIRRDLIPVAGVAVFLADVLVRNMLIAVSCYLNIYFLFDRFFRKGRYLVYAVLILGLLMAYTFLQHNWGLWLGRYLHRPENGGLFYNSYYYFSVGVFYLAFTLALLLSKRWFIQQDLLHQVQTEKLQTELQYLKAQLNPHFLFNSINTIYFQIDRSNVEARASLEKFSELLRYQLYECNDERIPIEREISYLQSYVDLQRLRKNSRNSILFNRNPDVQNFQIAPLLLLPFVENAFKHLSRHAESGNRVELSMQRKNGSFLFSISNSTDPREKKDAGAGIGLKNVRRRLDLLYPHCYSLDIKEAQSFFSVELQIRLS